MIYKPRPMRIPIIMIPITGRGFIYVGIRWAPVMENQMEKQIENEMETGIV